jgi:4-hydroxyphenylpyruvate dioxygenase-like putative hemolysin
MKIAIYNVVVDRDNMTKPSKKPWAWELPVLESKFPGGLVHVNGRTFVESDSLPDPAEEFARLQNQYGVDADTKQSHAELAYDRGDRGIALIAKVINGSEWNEKKEAAAAVRAAKAAAVAAEKALKKAEAAEAKEAKAAAKTDPTDPLA